MGAVRYARSRDGSTAPDESSERVAENAQGDIEAGTGNQENHLAVSLALFIAIF
jgi:hypothetical protein